MTQAPTPEALRRAEEIAERAEALANERWAIRPEPTIAQLEELLAVDGSAQSLLPTFDQIRRAAYVEVVAAALPQWRPIETAPKDGTEILLRGLWAGEINGISLETVTNVGKWGHGRTDYEGFTWSVSGTDAYAAWMKPTNWMPLPEPPK